ncbi:glycosyltransferase [Endozoicomonas gorgoniicola]|uniref:Glycosyltransferase n=1 Tax=Endozoicomonas gorgoniicola TaxID=1234144 RepID=A0ABT3MS50_9GAMM|nr:glycosyltransferase [Endozoicomonas gorgoniicola]MCW7552204.1 glycosyltransferase [Endozoicomonas gorgoniicola]
MKIAVIHDWLVTYGGAEKVLEQILTIFPEADLFSLIDFVENEERGFIKEKIAKTTFVQSLPLAKSKYRNYLPLFPIAIKQHKLMKYDIVISSSHCVAKNVSISSGQLHICYCYTPARYAWDLESQYLSESGIHGIKKIFVEYYLKKFRLWDREGSKDVDYFVACSNYISERIRNAYDKNSYTIYPNVSVNDFQLFEDKHNYFVTCSRAVPYKKIDLIVSAFSNMPDKRLIVIGDGPDFTKLQTIKTPNITLMGHQPFNVLKDTIQKARAFVFAAEEDFGIAPVEAMACGTPVIAYGKGGLLETVVNKKTGIFFYEQTADALSKAVLEFEQTQLLPPAAIREHALQFSSERFRKEFSEFVAQCWSKHCALKSEPEVE